MCEYCRSFLQPICSCADYIPISENISKYAEKLPFSVYPTVNNLPRWPSVWQALQSVVLHNAYQSIIYLPYRPLRARLARLRSAHGDPPNSRSMCPRAERFSSFSVAVAPIWSIVPPWLSLLTFCGVFVNFWCIIFFSSYSQHLENYHSCKRGLTKTHNLRSLCGEAWYSHESFSFAMLNALYLLMLNLLKLWCQFLDSAGVCTTAQNFNLID